MSNTYSVCANLFGLRGLATWGRRPGFSGCAKLHFFIILSAEKAKKLRVAGHFYVF